jgi:hypothetical protein
MPLCRQRGAAPRTGDSAMSSRLYAGNSVVSSTTRRSRLIQPFLYRRRMDGSDNVRGADNQQERLGTFRIHLKTRESSETIRRPTRVFDLELKIWSGPYGDIGRPAETTGPLFG